MKFRLPNDTLEASLEPFDNLITFDLVGSSNLGLCSATSSDTSSRTGHAGKEIHSVNTNGWVVLNTKINVLRNTKTEVSSLGKVALAKFILLDLETTFKNFLGLRSSDGDVDSDLLVSTDTESTDGVTSLACILLRLRVSLEISSQHTVHWSLTRKLLEHFGGTSKSITGLSDGNVKNELRDTTEILISSNTLDRATISLQLFHRVLCLSLSHCNGIKNRNRAKGGCCCRCGCRKGKNKKFIEVEI